MSHYRYECKHGLVLGQCRCPGPAQPTIVDCPDGDLRHQELLESLVQAPESNVEGLEAHEIVMTRKSPPMRVRTPEGLVLISTIMGTSVAVYDDEERNPINYTSLRGQDEQ